MQRTCTIEGCPKPHRARGLCVTHYNQTRYTKAERHPTVPTPCVICGTVTQRQSGGRYQHVCSSACRTLLEFGSARTGAEYDWAKDAVQRARRYGCTIVDVFDRLTVFDRDAWRCYLCGRECNRDADPLDPAAPTVDHVVALVNGGDHSLANVRTACYGCNSSKADRPIEQTLECQTVA